MNVEKRFKYFHNFLDECKKARENNKKYWVSQSKTEFVLWVVEK